MTNHRADKALVVQSLWGTVENVQRSISHRVHDLQVLILRLRRVQLSSTDPASLQRIDLVFHESNQRGHDKGNAALAGALSSVLLFVEMFEAEGWQLVT